MSHIASVNCEIKDLDALEVAAKKFGATLVRDKTRFRSFAGTNATCQHVIEIDNKPNAYSIGLRRMPKATEEYELACDFYDGVLAGTFGHELVGLRNEYQAVIAERTLARRGYRVRRAIDTASQIQVVATR